MKNFLRTAIGLLCALLAGCSTYEKRFADATHAPAKAGKFAGAYSGKWMSSNHPGGGGNLRCILTQTAAADYRADFHATWHLFHSEHSVVLHTKPAARKSGMGFAAGELSFEGTSALRTIIGAGTYQCQGHMHTAGGATFMDACYDATYDKGTFQLRRVATPGR